MNGAIVLGMAILFSCEVTAAEDLAPYKEGDKWGFKNAAGKVVVEPKYDNVGRFSYGLAPVNVGATRQSRSNVKTGGTWGYIDMRGTVVVPLTLRYASEFADGLGRVWNDKGTCYLDTQGKIVLELGREYAGDFGDGVAPVPEKELQTRFIDKTGQTVFTVDGSAHEFHEGMAVLSILSNPDSWSRLYGYIDRRGEIVVPPRFAEALDFHEGLAAVRTQWTRTKLGGGYHGIGDSWGYIEKSGQYVIDPHFNEAHPFRDGIARVHVGGTMEETTHFRPTWKGGEWQLIDRTGKVLKRSEKRLQYEDAASDKQP